MTAGDWTPFGGDPAPGHEVAGRALRGWPATVLSRGRVVIADRKRMANAGTGRFLSRAGGEAAKPTGRLTADMNPEQNFGARLL